MHDYLSITTQEMFVTFKYKQDLFNSVEKCGCDLAMEERMLKLCCACWCFSGFKYTNYSGEYCLAWGTAQEEAISGFFCWWFAGLGVRDTWSTTFQMYFIRRLFFLVKLHLDILKPISDEREMYANSINVGLMAFLQFVTSNPVPIIISFEDDENADAISVNTCGHQYSYSRSKLVSICHPNFSGIHLVFTYFQPIAQHCLHGDQYEKHH